MGFWLRDFNSYVQYPFNPLFPQSYQYQSTRIHYNGRWCYVKGCGWPNLFTLLPCTKFYMFLIFPLTFFLLVLLIVHFIVLPFPTHSNFIFSNLHIGQKISLGCENDHQMYELDKANPRGHWKHADKRKKEEANSLILKINHELRSIEVNKGQIYKELRYFLCILWNLIISNDEMSDKLGILI